MEVSKDETIGQFLGQFVRELDTIIDCGITWNIDVIVASCAQDFDLVARAGLVRGRESTFSRSHH